MGHHLVNGKFQSDKYPYLKPDHVLLSFRDKSAHLALSDLAMMSDDKEFADDIRTRLKTIKKEL